MSSDHATSSAKVAGTSNNDHPDRLDAAVLKVAGVVVLGAFMSILDITVVSVALETFKEAFAATEAQVAWTMTAYTLSLACVIPLTGWAADRFGTKRLYILALVLFTIGSALCATPNTLTMLVFFRVLQGLGGGMLMPLGMTIVTRAAGSDRVGRVMAVLGVPMLLGPIFGPIIGGWMIEIASWHWIFLINVPVGVLALIYAAIVLPKDKVERSESFDFLGMLLLSPGLALFLFGVSSIATTGTVWTPRVLVWSAIGVIVLIAFVPWSLSRANRNPLIDLRLLKNRSMSTAVVAMMCFAIAFFGASLLFPLFFQQLHGATALKAGLLLAPQGIGAMITMPIGGVLVDRIGPGKIVIVGISTVTVGMGIFTQFDYTSSQTAMMGALFVMGLGMGFTMMPIMTAALASLADHSIARGSTLMNILQQVGSSIGSAVFAMLLTTRLKGVDFTAPTAPGAVSNAFSGVFIVATVLLACVLVPALLLPRRPVVPEDTAPVETVPAMQQA